jgi:hypothetical protein
MEFRARNAFCASRLLHDDFVKQGVALNPQQQPCVEAGFTLVERQ